MGDLGRPSVPTVINLQGQTRSGGLTKVSPYGEGGLNVGRVPREGCRARTAGKSYSSRSQDIRMMVWSRSGPTEMMLMGTPHTSSKYSMYLRVFSGSSS